MRGPGTHLTAERSGTQHICVRDERQEAQPRGVSWPGLRLAPWPTTTAPPRAARSPMP
jgi:hypothetical protein